MKISLNVEFVEAEQLIWQLFKELPKEVQDKYSTTVSEITACLHHPSLSSDVLCSFRSDSTD